MKQLILIIFVMIVAPAVLGQSKKMEVAQIHTSVCCMECKDRLQDVLNYTKGIKYAEIDLDTKDLEIKFNTTKINKDEIRQLIADTGYDADHVKTTAEAMKNLPLCCRPSGK